MIVDVVNNIVRPFCRINSGILSACKTAAVAAGVGIRLRASGGGESVDRARSADP